MNGAHIHLLLNHIPILGSLFALCLLLYGIFDKSESVIKAALVTLVVTALVGIPAFLSGEEAGHVVDSIIGINKTAMEAHEEMAEIAFWSLMLNAAIALGTLLATRSSKMISMPLVWINVILLLVVFVLLARTGWLGGEIRHSEIQIEKSVSEEEEER